MNASGQVMTGVVLPGNSTVEFREYPVPTPGRGQVLVRMKASSICGSDVRAIYREHLGRGAEAYQGVIAGHEPCGQVVEAGPGCKEFREGDRVVIYHISGCGVCDECRNGYMIGCHGEQPRRLRLAARRRPRPVPAGRGGQLHPPARYAVLRRRRPVRLRLRHGLGGADAHEA